jgi:GTP-binding protein
MRKAIVDDVSGVTRDRHYGKCEWNGRIFTTIDTGGYVHGSEDIFEAAIRRQVEIAIEEADAMIFVVDVTCGITDLDDSVANMLRRSKKPIFLAVNKVDTNDKLIYTHEFHSLGLGELYPIASASGAGTGELLDDLLKALPPDADELQIIADNTTENTWDDEENAENEEKPLPALPKFALVGRPNVGKSTILNAFLGIERTIVTPIAGTTRDTIHTEYNAFGKHFMLIDTAGLRKKAKVHEDIEFYSVMRTIKAIEDCDVCILMLDATEGIGAQELNIIHLAESNKKGLIILANKWDLMPEKTSNTTKDFEEEVRKRIAPFTDVPIITTSATEKQRIFRAIETACEVFDSRSRRIKTSVLNEWLLPVMQQFPPPSVRGKYIKIKYVTQLKTATPSFVFFCNHPKDVRDSYKRFLENQFRKQFDFCGVPINIFFRQK